MVLMGVPRRAQSPLSEQREMILGSTTANVGQPTERASKMATTGLRPGHGNEFEDDQRPPGKVGAIQRWAARTASPTRLPGTPMATLSACFWTRKCFRLPSTAPSSTIDRRDVDVRRTVWYPDAGRPGSVRCSSHPAPDAAGLVPCSAGHRRAAETERLEPPQSRWRRRTSPLGRAPRSIRAVPYRDAGELHAQCGPVVQTLSRRRLVGTLDVAALIGTGGNPAAPGRAAPAGVVLGPRRAPPDRSRDGGSDCQAGEVGSRTTTGITRSVFFWYSA